MGTLRVGGNKETNKKGEITTLKDEDPQSIYNGMIEIEGVRV